MFLLRVRLGLWAGICLIVSGTVSSFGVIATAQQTSAGKTSLTSNPDKKAKFIASAWTVKCQALANNQKLVCALSQSIVTAKRRKRFVAVTVRSSNGANRPASHLMGVQLPHGLALASGVSIQIDKKSPHKLALYTSSAQGLYARIGLTGSLLSSLNKGASMKVIFSARNGRKIIVPMSLKGFSAGFKKLK